MAQFFINRPIFAWVLSIIIMLAGGLAIFTLPLEQYPDIAPPRVTISAQYTGASAETVENSVTQIIEQQLKGIDNMIYMSSTSDASGRSATTLTFSPGTNIDVAQVQVQNKLQAAMNRLPEAVKSRGVFVNKGGQDYLVTYSFFSGDPNVGAVDIGDYLNSNLVDVIGRLDGVGDIRVFGTLYAMRIWMDPAKMEKFQLMPSDLVTALNAQNAQVSAGQLGALPAVPDQQLNATITARTKLQTVPEFEAIVLKTATDGAVVTIKDVARVELGPDTLSVKAKLNGRPGAGMGIGGGQACLGKALCHISQQRGCFGQSAVWRDQRGDAALGVDGQVLGRALLGSGKVHAHKVIGSARFFQADAHGLRAGARGVVKGQVGHRLFAIN